jgi:hypothetical protein
MVDTPDMVIFWAVVMARFFVPLLIPKYPFPGVMACLVLDTIDQTIFQLTGMSFEGYQEYDKALDVYYLAITYLSTFRNWSNFFAFKINRFLFYYRLVGVALFELTDLGLLLLIFPNTSEYFFIFYELVSLKKNPDLLTKKKIIVTVALIWIFIKLPQEYLLHIAQFDTTDWIRADPVSSLIILSACIVVTTVVLRLILRDLPTTRSRFSFTANHVTFAFESPQAANIRDNYSSKKFFDNFLNHELIEKIVLVSLLSIIFANILPEVRLNNLQLTTAVSVLIIINTELSQWLARHGTHWKSTVREFIIMAIVNIDLVLLFDFLLTISGSSINVLSAIFFVLLLTLNVTLYDRYRRVQRWRIATKNYAGKQEEITL